MNGKALVFVALLSTVGALGGCAATAAPDPAPGPVKPAPETTEQTRLITGPTELGIAAQGSQAEFAEMALPIVGGQVKLSSESADSVQIDDIQVNLKDIVFDEVHMNAAGFRDVRVSLAAPVKAELSKSESGDASFATVDLNLLLDWSLVTNEGITVPLGTQHIDHVPVELAIYTTETGDLVVDVYGTKKGKVLSSGVGDLSDLAFDLYATK